MNTQKVVKIGVCVHCGSDLYWDVFNTLRHTETDWRKCNKSEVCWAEL